MADQMSSRVENVTVTSSWLYCDACGHRNFVSKPAKWRKGKSGQSCKMCGCGRLVKEKSVQELQWDTSDHARHFAMIPGGGWKWRAMDGDTIYAEGTAATYPACNAAIDNLCPI